MKTLYPDNYAQDVVTYPNLGLQGLEDGVLYELQTIILKRARDGLMLQDIREKWDIHSRQYSQAIQ